MSGEWTPAMWLLFGLPLAFLGLAFVAAVWTQPAQMAAAGLNGAVLGSVLRWGTPIIYWPRPKPRPGKADS